MYVEICTGISRTSTFCVSITVGTYLQKKMTLLGLVTLFDNTYASEWTVL